MHATADTTAVIIQQRYGAARDARRWALVFVERIEVLMTEETDDPFYESLRNKLKSVDVRTLEQTIAKAVGDLIGVQLNCSIDNVEYRASYARTSAKFNVSLSEPLNFDFGSGKSKESS